MWHLFIKNSVTQAFNTYFHYQYRWVSNFPRSCLGNFAKNIFVACRQCYLLGVTANGCKPEYHEHTTLLPQGNMATPIGNYVSSPPPTCIFENMTIWEIPIKYMVNACIRLLKRTDFRIIPWATTNMLSLTVDMT